MGDGGRCGLASGWRGWKSRYVCLTLEMGRTDGVGSDRLAGREGAWGGGNRVMRGWEGIAWVS
jgi:hypothetical protein